MCVEDRLVAYLFDSAVVTFGRVIENSLEELVNLGSPTEPKWESKYKLSDILSDSFRFPVDKIAKQVKGEDKWSQGISTVLALASEGTRGIRRWEYKPDAP